MEILYMEMLPMILVLLIYLVLIIYLFISSLVTTAICAVAIGVIPLICGLCCKKKALGWVGFAVCLALYWMNGFFLAQLASIIFTFFIVKDGKKKLTE